MNGCMVRHATQEEADRAREEWFALRGERKREADRREEVKKRQEEFHREWWEREGEGDGKGGRRGGGGSRSVRAYPT